MCVQNSRLLSWNILRQQHCLLLLKLLTLILFGLSAALDCPASTAADQQKIELLEERLFSHSYMRDNLDGRVNRLEDMVFGQKMPGSVETRASRLLAAVSSGTPPGGEHEQPSDSELALPQKSSDKDSQSPDMSENQQPAPDATLEKWSSNDGQPGGDESDRTQLALDIMLPGRGSERGRRTVTGGGGDEMPPVAPDVIGRTTREIAEAPLYTVRGGEARNEANSSRAVAPASSGLGLMQQIGAIELQLFGMTFSADSLSGRLTRLELTVFPGTPPAFNRPADQRLKQLLAAQCLKIRSLRGSSPLDRY